MEDLTLPFLLDALSRGSIALLLGILFWLFYTRRLVTKGELEECQKERDRLLADGVAERERVERRLADAQENTARIIADRDRLRRLVERVDIGDRRRK